MAKNNKEIDLIDEVVEQNQFISKGSKVKGLLELSIAREQLPKIKEPYNKMNELFKDASDTLDQISLNQLELQEIIEGTEISKNDLDVKNLQNYKIFLRKLEAIHKGIPTLSSNEMMLKVMKK